MDEERRRSADKRLDRLEEVLLDVHTKVNNGLSDRSKRTEEIAEKLSEQHLELNLIVQQHKKDDKKDHLEVLEEIKKISNQQEKFVRAKNAILLTVISILGTVIWAMFEHYDKIAQVLDHLLKDLR